MPIEVDTNALPADFPTHIHDISFWERLGRAVATFGFLEEVLRKAIFSFTARRPRGVREIERAYQEWLLMLKRAVSDPLGKLINEYGKAAREHPDANIPGLDSLLASLHEAARMRNVLCHGSWRVPDETGASKPLFVENQGELFDAPIDHAYLRELQQHVAALSCEVISSVTRMGWQFPGSTGPGSPIVGP